MFKRGNRARKKSDRKQHSRFAREIPWLSIICPPKFNVDIACACWMTHRFLRGLNQEATIRTSSASDQITSVYEEPYWTTISLGIGSGPFNMEGSISEIVLKYINDSGKDNINTIVLEKIIEYSKSSEILDLILEGTKINRSRVEKREELCAQKTLIYFGLILDALYQSLSQKI